MSPTLLPPEMYSTDLSYIVSTVEPTKFSPLESVRWTFTLPFSPGLYSCLRRQHLDVEHPLFRRHDDFLRLAIDLAAADRHRFDEEVRHVLLHDGDLFDRALALQPQHLRLQIDAVGRPHEQQHRAVGAVRC